MVWSNIFRTEGSERSTHAGHMPIVLVLGAERISVRGFGNPDAMLSASTEGGAAMSRYASARSSMLEAMGP